jgi:predicted nucleotidyltransferase
MGGDPELLARPNDILAVEYLKAIWKQKLPLTPFAVRRVGAGHDAPTEDDCPSASFLRRKLRAGEKVSAWIPPASAAALKVD